MLLNSKICYNNIELNSFCNSVSRLCVGTVFHLKVYLVYLKSLLNKETVIRRCHQPFTYLYYVLLTRVMHGKKSFMQRGTRVFDLHFCLKFQKVKTSWSKACMEKYQFLFNWSCLLRFTHICCDIQNISWCVWRPVYVFKLTDSALVTKHRMCWSIRSWLTQTLFLWQNCSFLSNLTFLNLCNVVLQLDNMLGYYEIFIREHKYNWFYFFICHVYMYILTI